MIQEELLKKTFAQNTYILKIYQDYLCYHATMIDEQMVQEMKQACHMSDTEAFCALFCALYGLDDTKDQNTRQLALEYLTGSICCLNVADYTGDPYYRDIIVPKKQLGEWQFTQQCYQPYEGFIYDDPMVQESYRTIPKLGFFLSRFPYPAVLQKGNLWMSVTPNEINTMRPVIEKAYGKVLTFGLGMGYFVYLVLLKPEVEHVTVIERDADVIRLFTEYILPQFARKDKVTVIQADAFAYANDQQAMSGYDYVFCDLWHDAGDGIAMYLSMKRILDHYPHSNKQYWIEKTMLSYLRYELYLLWEKQDACLKPYEDYRIKDLLREDYLREHVTEFF